MGISTSSPFEKWTTRQRLIYLTSVSKERVMKIKDGEASQKSRKEKQTLEEMCNFSKFQLEKIISFFFN